MDKTKEIDDLTNKVTVSIVFFLLRTFSLVKALNFLSRIKKKHEKFQSDNNYRFFMS